jgi:hypothetical protein
MERTLIDHALILPMFHGTRKDEVEQYRFIYEAI